jgi:hypothetical protein
MQKFDLRALLIPQVSCRQICRYAQGCDQCNGGVHNKPPKQEIADVQNSAGAEANATDNRAPFAILAIPHVAFDRVDANDSLPPA